MSREDVKIFLGFMLNFSITTGGTLMGAMLEAGFEQLPKNGVIVFALLTGFVQASLQAKALMEGRPPENIHDTVRQLVTQMKNVQTATARSTVQEERIPKRENGRDV